MNGAARAIRHDERHVFARAVELVVHEQGGRALAVLDLALRTVDVRRAEDAADILEAQVVAMQRARVHLRADGGQRKDDVPQIPGVLERLCRLHARIAPAARVSVNAAV